MGMLTNPYGDLALNRSASKLKLCLDRCACRRLQNLDSAANFVLEHGKRVAFLLRVGQASPDHNPLIELEIEEL